MSDIRAILALEPAHFDWKGQRLLLKRPSLTDLIDATQANEKGVAFARSWALWRHLLDENGTPVFESPEAAMACPLALALAANERIEHLYSEGSN